jgi:hypothetical protein
MFQDEARFGRVNITRKCWAPRGMRPIVGSQIICEYTYVYEAVNPVDGAMDSLILPEVNTSLFELFLREVSSRHPSEYIIMFMDGASWHETMKLELPDNTRKQWCQALILKHLIEKIFNRKGACPMPFLHSAFALNPVPCIFFLLFRRFFVCCFD